MKPDCATTFAPPWAIRCWSDSRNIYVEVPMKDPTQPPLVQAFPHTESGLTKALAIMGKRHAEHETKPGHYEMPQPKLSKTAPKIDDKARSVVRDILRKQGLV